MPDVRDPRQIFRTRLKEARQRAGVSQKQLGIPAGRDPFVASARINRYEQGVHEPDLVMLRHLADALSVPLAYFLAERDDVAELIRLAPLVPSTKLAAFLHDLRPMASSVDGSNKTP
jgi:transcriptional regulator with XRE-family HTH domain